MIKILIYLIVLYIIALALTGQLVVYAQKKYHEPLTKEVFRVQHFVNNCSGTLKITNVKQKLIVECLEIPQ